MNRKKQKKMYETIVTIAIRGLFFILFPAVFSTAFSGVKYIASQIGMGKSLEWNAFIVTFLSVIAFTACFGRFFCGFACAFGTYGDFLYTLSSNIQKKRKKKPRRLPEKITRVFRYGKYIVLLGIILICVMQKGAWISANSPWSVFSRFQSGNLPGFGIGVVLLVLVSIGMLLEPRFFCKFLCPLGAIFTLIPIASVSVVRRDKSSCIKGCQACKRNCPAALEIQENKQVGEAMMGECFSCGKCITTCPRNNITTGMIKRKTGVIYWHLIRGVLLVVLLYVITR